MPLEKRWSVKSRGEAQAVAELAASQKISPVLANLLVQRGIDTNEKASRFFNPRLEELHDPFLIAR